MNGRVSGVTQEGWGNTITRRKLETECDRIHLQGDGEEDSVSGTQFLAG